MGKKENENTTHCFFSHSKIVLNTSLSMQSIPSFNLHTGIQVGPALCRLNCTVQCYYLKAQIIHFVFIAAIQAGCLYSNKYALLFVYFYISSAAAMVKYPCASSMLESQTAVVSHNAVAQVSSSSTLHSAHYSSS